MQLHMDDGTGSEAAGDAGTQRSVMTLSALTGTQNQNETMPRSQMPHGTWANAKQVQENAIFTAVRRALEGMEDKLSKHMSKELTRVQVHGDRLREAAVSRLDAKVGVIEALQHKFDRRLAELSGSNRGLSEEMRSQIRRVDQMEAQLFAWRQQLNEELLGKFTSLEQQCVQVATSVRISKAGNDDALKRFTSRLHRLEELMEERTAHSVDLSHSVMNLHGRLLQCEEGEPKSKSKELQVATGGDVGDRYFMDLIEKQRADGSMQVCHLQQETGELRSKMEMQEESFKHLRTLLEAKEEHFKSLRGLLERENLDARLKVLAARVDTIEMGGAGHSERLEILNTKIDHQHETHSSILGSLSHLLHDHNPGLNSRDAADLVERELNFPRLGREDAKARAEDARRNRSLPELSQEHEDELGKITRKGTVSLVHHEEADSEHPEPIPGARFIVIDDPSLVCALGALIEPTGDADEWTVRLDNGTRTVLKESDFHVAPRPVASLALNTPLAFRGVQHYGPTEAIFEDEQMAMVQLADAAQVLRIYHGVVVSIEGHTATPDSKLDQWAHELAQNRAERVKDVLISLGVEEGRLKSIGLPGRLGSGKHDTVVKIVGY